MRVAALKTLEGTLLSVMLSERIASKGLTESHNKLLTARELADRFGVPESWVREQTRLGNLPSFKLGHYVRFRAEEIERFLIQRATQSA
jgi:excisionase family DNA binding protein